MAYENNQEILLFINRAQTYLRQQSTRLMNAIRSGDERERELARENFWQIYQFLSSISNRFISATWTETDIIRRIHHYNSKYGLNSFPHVAYVTQEITIIKGEAIAGGVSYATSQELNDEIAARTAQDNAIQLQVTANAAAIAGLDFSSVLATALSDYTPTSGLFLPANESVLESIDQQDLDDIALNNTHRNDGDIHVNQAQKDDWNSKPADDDPRLSDARAPTAHGHAITDVTGITAHVASEIATQIAALNLEDGETPVFDSVVINEVANGQPATAVITGPVDALVLTMDIPAGDKGDAGAAFNIDQKGDDADRFDSAYDSEGEDFAYLAEDTGQLYFRTTNPDATIPEGWTTGIAFIGNAGWAPLLSTYTPDEDHVYMEVIDWIGGSGDKPSFPDISNPPTPLRWLIGPAGFTVFEDQATNFKGPIGPDGGQGDKFTIDDTGNAVDMATHDGELKDYTFLRTDISPNVIFQKASDTSGDWAGPFPWQGPPGNAVIELPTQQSFVGQTGDDFNLPSGSLSIAAMGYNRIAYVDDSNQELRMYEWDYEDWNLIGSGFALGTVSNVKIAAMSPTRVALIDTTAENLRTLDFNGSVWAQTGSSLSIPGIGTPEIAALSSTRIAFLDSTLDELRAYDFNESIWAIKGSGKSISGISTQFSLTALGVSRVAADVVGKIRVYDFDDSVWELVGNEYTPIWTSSPSITALSSKRIARITSDRDELIVLEFDGLNWKNISIFYKIPGSGGHSITALSSKIIACLDSTTDDVRVIYSVEDRPPPSPAFS